MSVKITMIGAGYVGLVTGACLAEFGHDVICVDHDERKVDLLNNGELPIYEPGLEQLVQRNVDAGRLLFSMDTAANVRDRDAVFIAVGTPSEPGSDRADLKYVYASAKEIAQNINGFTVVVTKSTVPVGTNSEVAKIISENASSDAEWAVASNPEFLREGAAIGDFMEPDRIVIGCDVERGAETMQQIYAPLSARETPVVITDVNTAEMIKYAANAFLAVKISFINEVSDLCEVVGANVKQVAHGIGLDSRIGSAFLRVGPGWGGSCFPKDTRALLTTAKDVDVDVQIVEAAIDANTKRKEIMADRVVLACGGSVEGKTIGVLGLTFKGQTDDLRESPSLSILPLLSKMGAEIQAFDPSQPKEIDDLPASVRLVESQQQAAQGADVLVVLTDWAVFKTYDLQELASQLKSPVMVDLRNLFERAAVKEAGFEAYYGLGQSEDLPNQQ